MKTIQQFTKERETRYAEQFEKELRQSVLTHKGKLIETLGNLKEANAVWLAAKILEKIAEEEQSGDFENKRCAMIETFFAFLVSVKTSEELSKYWRYLLAFRLAKI